MTPAKCPGSECTFLFDPAAVPDGAVIACPSCGRKFTLTLAVFPSPTELESGSDFGFETTQAARAPAKRSRGPIYAAVGVVALVLIAFGVVAVATFSKRPPATASTSTPEFRKTDLNFAFRTPPAEWATDSAAQNAVLANVFAYKRTDPVAWVALSARDYGQVVPRPSELRDKVQNQLAAGFDHAPADLTATPVEWGGHKADRYPFRGIYRPTGETCVGDCFVLSHQGIAYWFYSWCPESAETNASASIAAVRDGFRTLGLRDKWKPTAAAGQTFAGRAVGYQLADPERIWAKPKGKEPTTEDPSADLFLEGTLKSRERGDLKPRAEVVVLVLESAANPMAAGREYVERRYRMRHSDAGNPVEFAEQTGEPEGDPPAESAGPGVPSVRLKMTVGDADSFRSADKLVVLSAVAAGGKVVVAEASCPWKERAVWERRLVQFVGSLTTGQ